MREIKFRAWRQGSEEMFEVGRIDFWDGALWLPKAERMDKPYGYLPTCDLTQYTGLKDKNLKEIYEGDIVTTGEGYGGFPSYNQEQPRLVEFRNGCWCFDAGRYDDGDWIRFGFWTHSNEGKIQLKQIEVIGNIYENKELLKCQ